MVEEQSYSRVSLWVYYSKIPGISLIFAAERRVLSFVVQ